MVIGMSYKDKKENAAINKVKEDPAKEAKMGSETKALCNSHPNLNAAPSTWSNKVEEEPGMMTKQGSSYGEGNRCAPDNNIFFEERSNHLSSKGD